MLWVYGHNSDIYYLDVEYGHVFLLFQPVPLLKNIHSIPNNQVHWDKYQLINYYFASLFFSACFGSNLVDFILYCSFFYTTYSVNRMKHYQDITICTIFIYRSWISIQFFWYKNQLSSFIWPESILEFILLNLLISWSLIYLLTEWNITKILRYV